LSIVDSAAFAVTHYSFLFTATDVDTVFGFKFRRIRASFHWITLSSKLSLLRQFPATSLLLLTAGVVSAAWLHAPPQSDGLTSLRNHAKGPRRRRGPFSFRLEELVRTLTSERRVAVWGADT